VLALDSLEEGGERLGFDDAVVVEDPEMGEIGKLLEGELFAEVKPAAAAEVFCGRMVEMRQGSGAGDALDGRVA
jgi:hypothetical protein